MSTMLYILGVALVVFVFLGAVRRVRRPEFLAAGLEVAVIDRLLLRAVDRTLEAVDIEGHAPDGGPGGFVLHELRT